MPDTTDTDTDTTDPDTAPGAPTSAGTGTSAPAKTPRRRSSSARRTGAPADTSSDISAEAGADDATVTAPPRKRAPRKTTSRRRSSAVPDAELPPSDPLTTPQAPAAPAGLADSTGDGPAAAQVALEPTAPTTPAVPEPAVVRSRTTASASSGFALLARAAPVFSHSPAIEAPVPTAVAADTAPVTPESLLAALDAKVPADGGRQPAAAVAAPPVPAAPVFVTPVPVFVDPADYWGTPPVSAETDDGDEADSEQDGDGDADAAETDDSADSEDAATAGTADGDGADPAPGGRRRRRRGGRRRRGSGERPAEGDDEDGAATTETADEQPAGGPATAAEDAGPGAGADPETGPDDAENTDEGTEDGAAGSRRRRRRRRRGTEDGEAAAVDDPPDTVVRVREPRRSRAKQDETDSEITSARGSTRIEAKRQRRRDGREARKRPPILTEAEFLARRESVARSMLVRERDGRTQIAVLEDGLLVEHYVAEESAPTDRSLIGDVYLGRVQNVLPAMEAAFIDIGRGRNAVLYAGEVDWDGLGMDGKPKRIELALKSGQSVLVQVTKDPIGQKGARLTAQVSLAGRYLVLVPNGSMSGISRKLPDTERARLKKILRALLPPKAGVIVRTAAEGASEEELAADVARLTGQWDAISAQAATASAPALLQGEPNLATKVVRDIFNEDFASLVVAGAKVLEQVRSYVGSVAPTLLDRVSPWTSEQDIFTANRVDEQLVKALDRKVFLPSGGSLVIDRTEAMTVVDVNTGRFTGSGGNLEETVTENNLEAAEELVRQLRLRDIGGIIVVDFIDMVFEANRDLVVRRLIECLGRDRTRHQVAEVSSLGLVQMTRKRIGRGLLEVFGHTCEACRGRGMVVDLEGHANGVDHEPAVAAAPRIPNPGNTGRAHLRTVATAVPAGDLPQPESVEEADRADDLAESDAFVAESEAVLTPEVDLIEVVVIDPGTGEVDSHEVVTAALLVLDDGSGEVPEVGPGDPDADSDRDLSPAALDEAATQSV